MSDKFWGAIIALTIIVPVIALLWVLLIGLPHQAAERHRFVEYCHQRGGVTEVYSRFQGKTVRHDRFCLTHDGRVLDIYSG